MSRSNAGVATILLLAIAVAFASLGVGLFRSDPKIRAEPVSEILPVWRELFARPDTKLSAIPVPESNQLTPEKISLGEILFRDKRLSGGSDRSCSTCHDPSRAFTDGKSRAASISGSHQLANTPPILNLAWAKRLFWDGRESSLEAQAIFPIEHPDEMAGSWNQIVTTLSQDANLVSKFARAFPKTPTPSKETITAAIASYERTVITPASRFDNFIAFGQPVLSEIEMKGFNLFVGKAGCASCHGGWRFTDDRLHRTRLSGKPVKTPTLRKVSLTAPYMHDGSLETLADVIAHYESLPADDPAVSPNLVRPLVLTEQEKTDLIAFISKID